MMDICALCVKMDPKHSDASSVFGLGVMTGKIWEFILNCGSAAGQKIELDGEKYFAHYVLKMDLLEIQEKLKDCLAELPPIIVSEVALHLAPGSIDDDPLLFQDYIDQVIHGNDPGVKQAPIDVKQACKNADPTVELFLNAVEQVRQTRVLYNEFGMGDDSDAARKLKKAFGYVESAYQVWDQDERTDSVFDGIMDSLQEARQFLVEIHMTHKNLGLPQEALKNFRDACWSAAETLDRLNGIMETLRYA
jgi:tetratricopeptide (TPR) repeat protein